MKEATRSVFVFLIFILLLEVVTPSDDVNCRCGIVNFGMRSLPTGTAYPLLFPWMVALSKKNSSSYCGGVLINKQEVLTAARCVYGRTATEIELILGVHDLSRVDSKDKYLVSKIETHEQFKANRDGGLITYDNDIAILHLKKEVTFSSNILPICLSPPTSIGRKATVTVLGWGDQSSKGKKPNHKLQMLTRPLHTFNRCGASWQKKFEKDKVTCMGTKGHNICHGDYGGPLQFADPLQDKVTLVGIASASGPVCGDTLPGLYTSFGFYKNWVKTKSNWYSKCYA